MMLSPPFEQFVLFPIDLRYGWDLPYDTDGIPPRSDCHRNTAMCAFSPLPDGQRSRKLTKNKSNFSLQHCIAKCTCLYGHYVLEIRDLDTGLNYTATAVAHSYKYCVGVCKDVVAAVCNDVSFTTIVALAQFILLCSLMLCSTNQFPLKDDLRKVDTSMIKCQVMLTDCLNTDQIPGTSSKQS